MELTKVKGCKVKCSVTDCSYNEGGYCHALSVTIGDHGQAMCDTFCLSEEHVFNDDSVAFVGACKVENCVHNEGLLCRCKHIRIGRRDDDFYCLSFMEREKTA